MPTNLSPRRIVLESRQMVSAVDVSPEDKTVLIGQYASDGPPVLSTFEASTGARQTIIDGSRHRNVEAARYLGTSGTIAYVTGEPGVEVKSAAGEVTHIDLVDERPASLSVGLSGRRIAVGGTHVSIVDDANVVASVPARAPRLSGEPARAAVAADGRVAAAGIEDGCIVILAGGSPAAMGRLAPAPAFARWVQFNAAGDRLVAIDGYANGVFGWDLASGERWLPAIFNERATSYWCGAFHQDGRRLYLGTNSGFVELVDTTEGRIVWSERVSDGRVWDMAVSKRYLAFGGDEGAWISAID
jgi:hypothetical protein